MPKDVCNSPVSHKIHNFRVKLSEVIVLHVRVQHNELHLPHGMRMNVVYGKDFGSVCNDFCRRVELGYITGQLSAIFYDSVAPELIDSTFNGNLWKRISLRQISRRSWVQFQLQLLNNEDSTGYNFSGCITKPDKKLTSFLSYIELLSIGCFQRFDFEIIISTTRFYLFEISKRLWKC